MRWGSVLASPRVYPETQGRRWVVGLRAPVWTYRGVCRLQLVAMIFKAVRTICQPTLLPPSPTAQVGSQIVLTALNYWAANILPGLVKSAQDLWAVLAGP